MSARLRKFRTFLQRDLWRNTLGVEDGRPPFHITLLRVLSLAWEGLKENQLFNRAAALSYSSLIGLGPLVAIAVLISGAYLKEDAENRIKESLLFIAPSLREYVSLEKTDEASDAESEAATAAPRMTELDALIAQIVQGSQETFSEITSKGRSAAGVIGAFILIAIGIQLLISIERTFNSIWGVKRGRGLGRRIVFYWTFITLGVLLGLGSTALFSASTFASLFAWLPFGASLTAAFVAVSPFLSVFMLGLLLTFVYQFFPHTTVRFRPALVGGATVALVLFLNNYLSILYVHQVIRMQSLYGSLGIVLVMMIGLYAFWIFVLFGAQITFALQNVHYLSHREFWRNVSVSTREAVTFATWTCIARAFHDCATPPSATSLSARLRVPGNIVNASLGLLSEAGWITGIREVDEDGLEETYYRPTKPLERYTLQGFRETFRTHGNDEGATVVAGVDPLMQLFTEETRRSADVAAEEPFDALLRKTAEND